MENAVERTRMLGVQRNEKTEHVIYLRFAKIAKNPHNAEILHRLADEELRHHDAWQVQTKSAVQPHHLKVQLFCFVTRIMGISFGLKLMERSHIRAKTIARKGLAPWSSGQPDLDGEDEVERHLLGLIDEERLKYVGAVVMGLSDALVELTGALAGFTFAMRSSRMVAMAGLITGIAAALSMGGTGYITAKSDDGARSPVKSAMYTGLSYIVTVVLLVVPYLLFSHVYLSLGLTVLVAAAIMFTFNFYVSVAKDVSFWRRFGEMVVLSLGIAALSFGMGFLVRIMLRVDI